MHRIPFSIALRAGTLFSFAAGITAQACPITAITADDATVESHFGQTTLALGDTLLVGAPGTPFPGRKGAVHVLERSGRHWFQTQELLPDDLDRHGGFGSALASDGQRLVVGAPLDDRFSPVAGVVRVYEREGNRWSLDSTLLPSHFRGHPGFVGFGTRLALEGDTLLIAAPTDPEHGRQSGSVHEYRLVEGEWQWLGRVVPGDARAGQQFGTSLALNGSTLVVGAVWDDQNGAFAGAAYVFERVAGSWVERQKLVPGDGAPFDQFGNALALEGDTLLIADANQPSPLRAGAVHAYERRGGIWVETQKLVPADLTSSTFFGAALALEGDRLLVGAPGRGATGSAYLYERGLASWELAQRLAPLELGNDAGGRTFAGQSVALAGDLAFAGGTGHGTRGQESGAVFAYSLSGAVCQTLFTDRMQTYGKQRLRLVRGPEHAGHFYWLGASSRGGSPGIRVRGLRIPLTRDPLLQASIRSPNQGLFTNNMGYLDAEGEADVILNIPAEAYRDLIGLELDFAYIEGTSGLVVEHVSNSVTVAIGRRSPQ